MTYHQENNNTEKNDIGMQHCRQNQSEFQQQEKRRHQRTHQNNGLNTIGNDAYHNIVTTTNSSNQAPYHHCQQHHQHQQHQQQQSLERRDKRNDSPPTPMNLPKSNSGMEQQQAVQPQLAESSNPISEENSHSLLDALMWWCSNDTTNGSFSEGTHHNTSTNTESESRSMNESRATPPLGRVSATVPNTVAGHGITKPNSCSPKTPMGSILSSYSQYLSSFTNSNRGNSNPTSNNSTINKGSLQSNNWTKTYMSPTPTKGWLQQDAHIAPTFTGWIPQQAQSCGCHYTNPLTSHSSTEWSYEAPGNDEVFRPTDVFPGGEKVDNMKDHESMATDAVFRHSRDGQLYTPFDGGSVHMRNGSFESDQDYHNPTTFTTPSRETRQIKQRPPAVTPHSAGEDQGRTYAPRPLSPRQFDPSLRIIPPGQLRQPVAAVVCPAMMHAQVGNIATLNPPPATITPGRFGSGPSQPSTNHWNTPNYNGGYVSNHHAMNANHLQDESFHHHGSVQLPNQVPSLANTAFDGEIAVGEAYNEMNNARDSSDMEVDFELQDMDTPPNHGTGFEVKLSGGFEQARVFARPNSSQGNLIASPALAGHEYTSINGPGRPISMPDPKQLPYSTLEKMDSKPPATHSSKNCRMGQEDHSEGGNFLKESHTNVPAAAGLPHRGPSRDFLSYMKATDWDVKLPPPPSAKAADAHPCCGKNCVGCDRKMCKVNSNNFVPPPPGSVGSSTATHGGARANGQKVGRRPSAFCSSFPPNIGEAKKVAGCRFTKRQQKRAHGKAKKKRERKPKVPEDKRKYVKPTANDIFCGRGGGSNNNPANKRYRHRILAEQKIYQALYDPDFPQSKSKADKIKQAYSREFLVREKTRYKSRFLDKDDIGWYEIHDEAARQKIGQGLREDHTVEGKEEKKARSAKGKGGAKKEQKKGKKKKDSK